MTASVSSERGAGRAAGAPVPCVRRRGVPRPAPQRRVRGLWGRTPWPVRRCAGTRPGRSRRPWPRRRQVCAACPSRSMSFTTPSGTRSPVSTSDLMVCPSDVRSLTCWRSRSPLEMCAMPSRVDSGSACVPCRRRARRSEEGASDHPHAAVSAVSRAVHGERPHGRDRPTAVLVQQQPAFAGAAVCSQITSSAQRLGRARGPQGIVHVLRAPARLPDNAQPGPGRTAGGRHAGHHALERW